MSPNHRTPFLRYADADAAHGRLTDVSFLGRVVDADACEQHCVRHLGPDPTHGCTSFTFYHSDYHDGTLASKCYGDSTGAWRPFYSSLNDPKTWGGVTSGQNAPHRFRTPCTSSHDCSYNGRCVRLVCECYSQWMGKYCNQLRLAPTDSNAGLQSLDAQGRRISTWGGSVVRDQDGTYHMWASEMINSCGIVVWLSNSRIRHAVSTNGPAGPYEPRDVAEGLWGHEPTVVRAPAGEFVLFWTADFDKEVPCSRSPCNRCDDGNTAPERNGTCLPDTRCSCASPHPEPAATHGVQQRVCARLPLLKTGRCSGRTCRTHQRQRGRGAPHSSSPRHLALRATLIWHQLFVPMAR